MHTSLFSAKGFVKFLNVSPYVLFILSVIALSACSSVGVSGMYAANAAAVPAPSGKNLETKSADNA
ncbi:MAG: hypothetical protein LBL45_04655, partial [Treponema sp.]|nr:hypothetical protein [Treponema sp.]